MALDMEGAAPAEGAARSLATGIVDAPAHSAVPAIAQEHMCDGDNLIDEVRAFLLEAAPRPVNAIADAGAICFINSICGNAYNISNSGTNTYILSLAPTGTGKDAYRNGSDRLINAIWESPEPFPHRGAELVSSSGLIKWTSKHPCHTQLISEFGKKLPDLTNPNRPNSYAISRTLLQLYSLSGKSDAFEPLAYADSDKVTKRIERPSVSIFAESIPESFYETLSPKLIADGFLPRFIIFDYQGKRPYFNKASQFAVPSKNLIERLRSFMAACNAIRARPPYAYDVSVAPDAEALFDEFDRWTTNAINGGNEVTKQLWNRAHLNALKVAALRAVATNWFKPIVTLSEARWATDLIAERTKSLIAKFETGDIGEEAGNQTKQIREVKRVICEYFNDPNLALKYHPKRPDFQPQGVITFAHIQQRLGGTAAFRHDRLGPDYSLKRAVKYLVESDLIRQVATSQLEAMFGQKPTSYVMADPKKSIRTRSFDGF